MKRRRIPRTVVLQVDILGCQERLFMGLGWRLFMGLGWRSPLKGTVNSQAAAKVGVYLRPVFRK